MRRGFWRTCWRTSTHSALMNVCRYCASWYTVHRQCAMRLLRYRHMHTSPCMFVSLPHGSLIVPHARRRTDAWRHMPPDSDLAKQILEAEQTCLGGQWEPGTAEHLITDWSARERSRYERNEMDHKTIGSLN